MAQMIPDVSPDTIEHESERLVYVALRDQLPARYRVIHSFPWLRPDRDRLNSSIRQGEADFVILDPDQGFLVLEVKGGTEMFARGRHWYRKLTRGEREIRNPFKQASDNMHALKDAVRERTGGRLHEGRYTFGFGVVFPQGRAVGPLPHDARTDVLIDMDRMHDLERIVPQLFATWARRASDLTRPEFVEMLDVLLPTFKMVRPIGPDLESGKQRLLELTENQALAFRGLFANRQLLVEGVAGSGKTLLALERAIGFAREGCRCLFVCYNKELAAWLREQVEADPTLVPVAPLLDIVHFHALAARLTREADVPFEPPIQFGAAQRFWDDEAATILETAAVSLYGATEQPYDALVVDEAQDFSELWWYALYPLIKGGEQGRIFVFMDLAQSLRPQASPPPFGFDLKYALNVNCRNTQKIARMSAALVPIETVSPAGAPPGPDIRMIRAGSPAQMAGLVAAELKRLLAEERLDPSRIVLLAPSAKEKSSLVGVAAVVDVPITTSAAAWRAGKGVLCTTARSFKGLEADAVLLFDLATLGPWFTEADLYVACSRARLLLVLVTQDERIRARLEQVVQQSKPI